MNSRWEVGIAVRNLVPTEGLMKVSSEESHEETRDESHGCQR